ncbi:MAG: haloacid dehalogenase-like hydrolase [Candidatus Schekmanbacteria bacterium]|nr:haloacid dehalogenase-like hydrolase [Candidatus Schekmanbacteria bacterium]
MSKEKYLFVSDFDKTLSLDDSGYLLAEKLGISPRGFDGKVEDIRRKNIVQLGGELAYLITSDKDFCGKVSKTLLQEVGKETKLKKNVAQFISLLNNGIDNTEFYTCVTSAGPWDIISQALEGIIPPENIYATTFSYDELGIVTEVIRTGAGDAKVATLDELKIRQKIPRSQIIYVGDGTSDVHVMLHVRAYNGFPIAVSSSPYMGHIAKRTVISDNALAVLIPILEVINGYTEEQIIDYFAKLKRPINEWNRAQIELVDLGD